jgi:hypothetical protein
VSRRHVAAARLSRQFMTFHDTDSCRFRAAFRPSNAPLASASKTSAGPRRPNPSKTCSKAAFYLYLISSFNELVVSGAD